MRWMALVGVLLVAGITGLSWRRLNNADAAYARGERLYQAGDFEKASLECERALKRSPGHAPAKALFMEVQFILGQGKGEPVGACYEKYMTSAQMTYASSFTEMDQALDRAERGDEPEKHARRALEYAKWLPEGPELQSRLDRARELLAR